MNTVFLLNGEWKVRIGNQVLSASWLERGPAEACLSLIESGKGAVTPSGGVKWVLDTLPPNKTAHGRNPMEVSR